MDDEKDQEAGELLLRIIDPVPSEETKDIGNLMSSRTGLTILNFMIANPQYKMLISNALKIKYNLTDHHMKKLLKQVLVKTSQKKIIRKGVKHTYYETIKQLIIFPVGYTKEELEKPGALKKLMKNGIKFTSVGIVGLSSWFGTQMIQQNNFIMAPPDLNMEEPMIEFPLNIVWSIILTGIFVGVSIFLLRLKKRKKDD